MLGFNACQNDHKYSYRLNSIHHYALGMRVNVLLKTARKNNDVCAEAKKKHAFNLISWTNFEPERSV